MNSQLNSIETTFAKNLRRTLGAASFILAGIFWALPQTSHAEATQEYYRDAGLSPVVHQTVFTFGGGAYTLDLHNLTDPTPPEGLETGIMNVDTQWAGWGIFTVDNSNNPVNQDLSAYSNGHIRFWLKSTVDLTLEIQYNSGLPADTTIPSTGGVWVEEIVPMSVYFGADFSKISSPFVLVAQPSASPKSFSVDHIRWTKPVANLVSFPSSTQAANGQKRQFTIEGRDAANELVIVYSTFTAPGLGTMTPTAPAKSVSSILSATGASGSVTATAGNRTINVPATGGASNLPAPFGLLSETISGVNLTVDSTLLISFGGTGGATEPFLLDEPSTDVREGFNRFKTTIHPQSTTDSFTGWFIQWDTSASDAITKNMSSYYDGALHFWFKGPPALQNNLQVIMRSGNVTAGTELSKVLLKNFTTFDDQWHSVVIPLSQFAKSRPWADLSRMKVMFGMFAIGATSGDQTFYVDNVRWDSQLPGALTRIAVSPNPVTIPLSAKRTFTAAGFDSNNVTVDIWPTWTVSGAIGSLSSSQGTTVLLTAPGSAATGSLTATEATISSTTNVSIANIIFTQYYNVYSDLGSGGFVGVATGGGNGTALTINEQTGAGTPEGSTFRRANFSLVNSPGLTDAFALWFTEESNGSRYMRYFQDGYLQFWIRTNTNLQVSVRSNNILPGAERSKIKLSDLGIPLDNTWQKVVVSLATFKALEPLLDFDQIKTYFAIGGVATQIGPVSNRTFDVDDVRWLTANSGAPSETLVYAGLKAKQHASGLLLSFDMDASSRAVTYDQALAALNFTYRKDLLEATKVLDVYKNKFLAGGFAGFADEYRYDAPGTIVSAARSAGPNAWIMLAMIHYKSVFNSTTYDTTITGLATWLRTLQDTTAAGGGIDGGIKFGFNAAGSALSIKSTEHNFDVYAAFNAYYMMTANAMYKTAADNVLRWLQTTAWNAPEGRFNVGVTGAGVTDTDFALDLYSWAPLAISSYSSVLPLAVTKFGNTKISDLTGVPIEGFDFGGMVGNNASYTDAVWLEGTAQMASAYWAVEDPLLADHYLREVEKGVVNISPTTQGLAYATNGGTGYGGFAMDSQHFAISPAAWYLIAKKKFNPFHPFRMQTLAVKTLSGVDASSIMWTANLPTRWVVANHYIKLESQAISATDVWGIQIYTDNKNASANPRFVDRTPANIMNSDSDPAGLMRKFPGQSTTSVRVPLAWSIKDSTTTVPPAIGPATLLQGASAPPSSYQWSYFKDRSTPAIDADGNGSVGGPFDGTAFTDGEDYVTVINSTGLHSAQGPAGYFPGNSPDYIYLEADFSSGHAQAEYTAPITLEVYTP